MPAILLVCTLAGALLVAALLVRGGVWAGCLAILLAASCFGHEFFFVPTYPIPLTADRALLLGLILQYVIHRRIGRNVPKPMRGADWPLLGLIGVVLLSTFTHDWRFKNNWPAAQALFCVLIPSTLYWIARQSPMTRRHVAWLLGGLAVFGLYLSFTAYCEVRGLWSAVFPRYIAEGILHPEYFGRGRGPYMDPTANGVILTV